MAGVFLPKMCEVRQGRARREMVELRSGGGKLVAAAAVPESMESHASSPQSSVVFLGLGPVQPPL